MRRFVIGDIHGAYKALIQCLQKAHFSYEEDHLICLGDVCDGWPETNLALEELLKIKNLTLVKGNHDFWAEEWARTNEPDSLWLNQGGAATVNSYPDGMPKAHYNLLKKAFLYYLEDNKLFVHAGIEPGIPLEAQGSNIFLWDRSLFKIAFDAYQNNNEQQLSAFEEIYIGHTPIHNYDLFHPIKACEVWCMDTGAGWNGVLSLMDIDSKETFISDRVDTMYPKGSGRIKHQAQ
ncbi:metallophosphoesterase [Fulvivirga maritima]|uniref:metallophosphoesterase n=1 Tax=Fulvivirga maritima TaxID=2904247 RepID=UPI001F3609DE|nr:metallophosphoesterase [Fulvivirga maritima]UII28470.1 metallophosphoesterase [Fulvivirga maritima]